MLEAVTSSEARHDARSRAARVLAGANELAREWLTAGDRVVLPVESALHFDTGQCERLAEAARIVGVARLIAVPTEQPPADDPVLALEAVSRDLEAFSRECGSLAYLLIPSSGTDFAVVCTTDDFLLIAGSCDFVRTFAVDVQRASQEFLGFVQHHFEVARGPLLEAARYLDGPWNPSRC